MTDSAVPGLDALFHGSILDDAGIGVWVTDLDWRLISLNEACARMCGYGSAAEMVAEVRSLEAARYVDPAQRMEMYRTLSLGLTVRGMLVQIRRRDGSPFWALVTAAPEPRGVGQAKRFIGSTIDVDELIRTREALRIAEVSYRGIFDNATEGIYRSSPEGRQLRANAALVRLNGYDSEAEMLAAVRDIAKEWYVDPGRRAEFQRLLAAHGRIADFESEVYRHKTRERIWITENAWLVRDGEGKPLYYEGTVQDITQRRRAEAALRLSEVRFRDYAETASDWFWETGPDHRFVHISSSERLNPKRSEEMIGQRRLDVATASAVEAQSLRRHLVELEAHQPFRDFVYRMIGDDGTTQYISTSGKPIFDEAGGFQGYRGSARVVTESILAETRLREAKVAAEAASDAKSAFLATMSHELRTPLNAIIGFAELMMNQATGPLPPRYIEYSANIAESGQHLLQLVNDVLDMSKILAGHMNLDEERVMLADVCRRHMKLMAAKATESGVAHKLIVQADLPPVLVDPLRLGQILFNLISNATKFTPRGGQVEIFAGLEADGRIAVAVSDTGIGMSAAEVAIALEPFRQVDATSARRFEGTGLGLPISKSLAELHGGELRIESRKGRGTTVTVLLPASRVLR
ncbi:MAG: PAS domain S-box protein [Proteobacteria bacterium]|nr:PAS domain S-box protein [Pseudomonadota bacterium]MBI3496220.1 PAS domain S-box protein [Pseudomonadota bacterium]